MLEQKKKHLCVVWGCLRDRGKKARFCPKHHSQHFRAAHPIQSAYNVLKSNAKRRDKSFLLSKEYFKEWCEEHNYIKLKGIYKSSMSIDRVEQDKGYEEGNLQMLTNGENIDKYYKHDKPNYAT